MVLGDLELVQALGRAGIRCVAVAPSGSKVRRSRYVAAAVDAAPPTAPAPYDEALVERLLALAEGEREPPLLMCDSDEALDFLDHNRSRLEPRLRTGLPPSDQLRSLTDKARFQELARRLELATPRGQTARPAEEPPPLGLRPPVVLKAVPHRNEAWRAIARDEKALVADTEEALAALWRRVGDAGMEVLVQECVPGPETDVVSYHAYVDRGGEVAGEFTGRKIRTFPSERGMSTALVTTDDSRVAALGRDLVRRMGLRGPLKLDFKRDHAGELWLLEVNPRFTLWAHPGAVAGVNLPALMYADFAGRPERSRRSARPGVRWVSLRRDRHAARAEGMSSVRWLAWALRCETNSAFAWRDPGPLLGMRRGSGLATGQLSSPRASRAR